MKKSLACLIPLGSAVAILASCSSKPPPPPNPPTTTADAGVEAGAITAPPPSGTAAAPADAGAPPFFTGGADAGTTAPPLAEAALDSVIDLAIAAAAPKVAPKMDKEGAAGHATLAEGQHFSMIVNLGPNRCYTVVATSAPGMVSDMELKLYAPPLYNVEAGHSTKGEKNLPVIGKGTAALCPIIPLQVPYKVDVAAVKGSGRIGVQVFARNK
jgi:hypothetical protein